MTEPKKYTQQQIINALWTRGRLRYKLRVHQYPIYNAVWDAIAGHKSKYVVNCARRFGKTTVLCIVALEYALRSPDVQIRFAAPSAKQLEKIIFPIMSVLLKDCPQGLQPKLSGADNVYRFSNGSEIHLAGVDAHHAESLRGVASHLNILDEAGSMDSLLYVMQDILMPLTLTTGGTTVLASTPATYEEHDYTTIARDAREHGDFIQFTIDDNTSLTVEQRARAIEDSGGSVNTTTYKREYMCQFVTELQLQIIPEWDDVYVHEIPHSEYYKLYHKYVAMDIGFRDNTAILFGYYDFENATLVIEDEITASGHETLTSTLHQSITDKLFELWQFQKPYRMIADNNDPKMLAEFSINHQMHFLATSKDSLQAMINEVRMWFAKNRVAIHPRCKMTIGCVKNGIWRLDGTRKVEFAKSKIYKHYDHLAALVYMIRNIDEFTNPIPFNYHHTWQTYVNPYASKRDSHTDQVLKRAFGPRTTKLV